MTAADYSDYRLKLVAHLTKKYAAQCPELMVCQKEVEGIICRFEQEVEAESWMPWTQPGL